MRLKFLFVMIALLLPTLTQTTAQAADADIVGTSKVREGNIAQVGASRIRLGGLGAHSGAQLRPDTTRARARPSPTAAAGRDARSMAKTSRNGWCATDGRYLTCGSRTTTTTTRR